MAVKRNGDVSEQEAWEMLRDRMGFNASDATLAELRQLDFALLERFPRGLLRQSQISAVKIAIAVRRSLAVRSANTVETKASYAKALGKSDLRSSDLQASDWDKEVGEAILMASRDVLDDVLQEEAYTKIKGSVQEAINNLGSLREATGAEIDDQNSGFAGKLIALLAVNELIGLGPIDPLWRDPMVEEISINGPYDIQVHLNRFIHPIAAVEFANQRHLKSWVNHHLGLSSGAGRALSQSSHVISGFIGAQHRFHTVSETISKGGPDVSLRKSPQEAWTPELLVSKGGNDAEMIRWLASMAHAKLSMLVVGSTGAGKTTLMSAMLSALPDDLRIVTLEDNLEIQRNPRKLFASPKECLMAPPDKRTGNHEDDYAVGMPALVMSALREKPDVVVIGETRDSAMRSVIRAATTGHVFYSTFHGNSALGGLTGAIHQVRGMDGEGSDLALAAEQVKEAFDLVVFVGKGPDGRRRILEVAEVVTDTEVDMMRGQIANINMIWKATLKRTGPNTYATVWEKVGSLSDERKRAYYLVDEDGEPLADGQELLSWDEIKEISAIRDPWGQLEPREEVVIEGL